MKKIINTISICGALLMCACNNIDTENDPITYGDGYMPVQLNTDKAAYKPGETVNFSLNKMIYGQSNITIRYRHLNNLISEQPLNNLNWSWQPPTEDFKGYMIDLYNIINGEEIVYGSIAVDVSSDIARFPRNGFLSIYGEKSQTEINKVIDQIGRAHV